MSDLAKMVGLKTDESNAKILKMDSKEQQRSSIGWKVY